MKKINQYRLVLSSLEEQPKELSVVVENHDDIFEIVQLIEKKLIFDTQEQAQAFAIGLKLLSEEVIKKRNDKLFSNLFTALSGFIQQLKQYSN